MATENEAAGGAVHRGAPLQAVERDTLLKIFFHGASRYERADAVRHKVAGRWQPVSHPEIVERVARLAAGLHALGIAAGDRVAILSENRPEWLVADYAVLGLGAVTVPLYPSLPAEQLALVLRDSGARFAFASTPAQAAKLRSVRASLPALEQVVAFEPAADTLALSTVIAQATEADPRGWFRTRAAAVRPGDLATLIYTSGTSGTPKGVMLSHLNLASMVAATRQHGSIDLHPGDVALSLLPLSHVFERAVDYYYWDSGVSIAYAESVERAAENLAEVRPHAMVAVPRLFEKIHARVMGATGARGRLVRWAARTGEEMLAAREEGRPIDAKLLMRHLLADRLVFAALRRRLGGRVRALISGGAPLSEPVARFFWAAGITVHEGYGLTETSPVLAANRPGARRAGTVGVPYPGVELRLGESGEILARGPGVMMGYWNDPDATAAALDAEGWLRTGDVGEFDADGFLRITDRLKDLIVTAGGKNVAPAPIESAAAGSPFVAQAVMIGDRRPYPVLLLVPDFDALVPWAAARGLDTTDRARLAAQPAVHDLLRDEAMARLEGLAAFEQPKKVAVVAADLSVESGLLTPTLKVRRRAVEERFRDALEALYAEPR